MRIRGIYMKLLTIDRFTKTGLNQLKTPLNQI
jgi:hypothetical protein